MVIKGDIEAAIAKVKALRATRQPFSYCGEETPPLGFFLGLVT
jgi:hypothetical protein